MASRKKKPGRRRRLPAKRRGPAWADLPTEQLLDVRLCDLGVQIVGSPMEPRIQQVCDELARRGLRFRPHFWVSEDWFSPQGVPGCAVPFYLLHPRLTRLERRFMLEAEGAGPRDGLKLLRHEVGHAIDHAYRLYLRRKRQRLFGLSSKPYPETYLPKPFSRNYVQHIDYWYAQAHPDEDFAETFAVWLRPRSGWRKVYDGWPVMRKLRYVNDLMGEIADTPRRVTSRERVDPLHGIRKTLREYYAEKQQRYGTEYPDFFDADLRKLFSAAPEYQANESAAAFLRRARPTIRHMVSRWTGYYEYTLDQVLKGVIGRCRELRLRRAHPAGQTRIDAAIMLTVNSMNFLYSGRRWLDL
ncbi:MAG TPA: hypothetical protein VM431_04495 [Phycisphaerae bacterium]|nr:hypothetical protein [Phycisphaerae bacterium]